MTPRRRIAPERLAFVQDLWLTAVAEHAIVKQAVEKFHCTPRAAQRYVQRVRAKLGALPASDPAAVRARSEAMLLHTYDLASKAVKYVTHVEGTTKHTEEHPAPDVGTMATVASRLVEIHGAKVVTSDDGPRTSVTFYLPEKDATPASVTVAFHLPPKDLT